MARCQSCGAVHAWHTLFDAKELTGVKAACVSCIDKAARIEGAKAMQAACDAKLAEQHRLLFAIFEDKRYDALFGDLRRAICAPDPAAIVKGGG